MHHEVDRVWRIPSQLWALAPEPSHWLDEANKTAWKVVPPDLLEQVRMRVAGMLSNSAGLARRSKAAAATGLTAAKIAQLPDYFRSDVYSEHERDVLLFVEQFVMDVSMFTDSTTEALRRRYGPDGIHELVTAIYITEFAQRLELVASVLFGTTDEAEDDVSLEQASADPELTLQQTMAEYQAAAMRGRALDPILTELVRLRCARTHNCRICQTLRATDARTAGADDAMTEKIDFYEASDLDERTKVALRITDAFITTPDVLTDALIRQAWTMFSGAELAELCFDITKWSTQKIKISLGLDGADALATDENGLSFFKFDDDGQPAGFTTSVGPAAGY